MSSQAAGSSGPRSINEMLPGVARQELKRLEFRTRRILDADLCGRYRSAFRGSGLVYSDLREYQPGDEIKAIHWKISARAGKVYVKSYEEDRQLNVMLVVDVSRSTLFGQTRSKHEKAFEFAALVAMLAQINGDAIGLCLFSKAVEEFLKPARSRTRVQRVLLSLMRSRELQSGSNLEGALEEVLKDQKRRALVFIVSDFFCPPFGEPLRRLSAKHDVICAMLEDNLDSELPNAGIVQFLDAETNQTVTIDTSSARVRKALEKAHAERIADVGKCCLTSGADFIRIKNNTLRPLADLMRQRMKRVSRVRESGK